MQTFIKKYKPNRIIFTASKEVEQGQNAQSRARLYDSLVQRYARAWGFRAFRADTGNKVMYELNRINKTVAETSTMQYAAEKIPPTNPYGGLEDNQFRGSISEAADKKISFKIQKGNGKFSTTLTVNDSPAGIYQYDSNTGRSIAEVYPEFKGKGLGKLLVLHAIYTAAQLGLDFQEDESRTSAYDNVLDSLSSNGYIVDDDGYWYVTGEGEQYLKQSLNEASGYIPSEKEKNDPRFKTALTVDVKPDSIKKNAKAFSWLTSRAGIPPTANTNGKI
jgi:GNAT superfamily N-acetyltransferase